MLYVFNSVCDGNPAAAQVSFTGSESGMHKAKAAKNPKIPSTTAEFVELLGLYQHLGLNHRATATADNQSAVIFVSEDVGNKLDSGDIVEMNLMELSSPHQHHTCKRGLSLEL
jgi:hypothetical protein